ncbi:hypothetical protein [Roseibium litorale]|uniref:Uncharacterized protein n=1 Tax=Roseibium litorale TaxID=2803841 RepID=A0ABR9CQT7_9HYPH|nr:hypothetical protein [Roseibium litorale]MBD8893241.1 hypothetical protein [Roseibium litorale]
MTDSFEEKSDFQIVAKLLGEKRDGKKAEIDLFTEKSLTRRLCDQGLFDSDLDKRIDDAISNENIINVGIPFKAKSSDLCR